MSMTVERKKYSGDNMWNKIKSKLPITFCTLVLAYMFWGLYQTDNQFRDRLIDLELKSSHYRTDIIGLKSDLEAFGITMTFHRNEIDLANTIFRKKLTEDVEHELGILESKLKRLDEELVLIDEEYTMKDELIRRNIFSLIELSDTLKNTDKETLKGTQSLQEQFDQLRLEFDELVERLKNYKRTKDIF